VTKSSRLGGEFGRTNDHSRELEALANTLAVDLVRQIGEANKAHRFLLDGGGLGCSWSGCVGLLLLSWTITRVWGSVPAVVRIVRHLMNPDFKRVCVAGSGWRPGGWESWREASSGNQPRVAATLLLPDFHHAGYCYSLSTFWTLFAALWIMFYKSNTLAATYLKFLYIYMCESRLTWFSEAAAAIRPASPLAFAFDIVRHAPLCPSSWILIPPGWCFA
jgi:hypothetical protein